MKKNVYFLLGCPCSGKTTVGKILAEKYDMVYFSGDVHRHDYDKLADPAKHKFMTKDASTFFDWSLDEMVAWEKGMIAEHTPYILDDLKKLSEENEYVLYEGMIDIDQLSKEGIAPDHIVYLTVDREVAEELFFDRGDHKAMVERIFSTPGISDEEKNRRADMRKAASFGAFYEDPAKLKIKSFTRGDGTSSYDMADQVEKHFGLN